MKRNNQGEKHRQGAVGEKSVVFCHLFPAVCSPSDITVMIHVWQELVQRKKKANQVGDHHSSSGYSR